MQILIIAHLYSTSALDNPQIKLKTYKKEH